MRGSEEDRERPAFRLAHHGSPVAADRVHDRANVVHAHLERGGARDAVRHAHTPLVEQDQTCELREALAVSAELRQLPVDLEMRVGALHVDEVDGPVPDDAVRDVDVAAAREPDLGHAERLPDFRSDRARSL